MSARDELLALDGSDEWPAQVDALLAEHRAKVLAEAIEAARSEYLHEDTGTPEDEAYNQGVTDAVAAIGALLEAPAAVPVPDESAGDESAVEFGVRAPYGDVLTPTPDRAEAEARLARYRDMHPDAVLVQRTVRYGTWTEVTS